MTRRLPLCLCLALLSVATPALASSLFYSPTQTAEIDNEIHRHPQPPRKAVTQTATLDSIVYFGPNDWIFWLSGEKWTPTTSQAKLRVLSVTPDAVTLALHVQGQAQNVRIYLKPMQSVDLLTGVIAQRD